MMRNPYVQPLVGGKVFPDLEVGAILSVWEIKRNTYLDRVSQDVYSEGGDLQKQAEVFI